MGEALLVFVTFEKSTTREGYDSRYAMGHVKQVIVGHGKVHR